MKRIYSRISPSFERRMGGLLGASIVGGKRVDALDNGDLILPAMLEALVAAIHSQLQKIIHWSGEIGRRVSEALAEPGSNGRFAGPIDTHLIDQRSATNSTRRCHRPGRESRAVGAAF